MRHEERRGFFSGIIVDFRANVITIVAVVPGRIETGQTEILREGAHYREIADTALADVIGVLEEDVGALQIIGSSQILAKQKMIRQIKRSDQIAVRERHHRPILIDGIPIDLGRVVRCPVDGRTGETRSGDRRFEQRDRRDRSGRTGLVVVGYRCRVVVALLRSVPRFLVGGGDFLLRSTFRTVHVDYRRRIRRAICIQHHSRLMSLLSQMLLERVAELGLVGAIDASVRIYVGVLLQVASQHRFADARVCTFLALERFGAIVNAQPVVFHMMLVFGNEGTLGAREAFDVTAHVLPVFHLGIGHVAALFTGFTISINHLVLLPINAKIRKTNGRSIERVYLAFRASSQSRGDGRILLGFGGREMRKTRDPRIRIVAFQRIMINRAVSKF